MKSFKNNFFKKNLISLTIVIAIFAFLQLNQSLSIRENNQKVQIEKIAQILDKPHSSKQNMHQSQQQVSTSQEPQQNLTQNSQDNYEQERPIQHQLKQEKPVVIKQNAGGKKGRFMKQTISQKDDHATKSTTASITTDQSHIAQNTTAQSTITQSRTSQRTIPKNNTPVDPSQQNQNNYYYPGQSNSSDQSNILPQPQPQPQNQSINISNIIGSEFESVKYVPQISDFAHEDLIVQSDPNHRMRNLIGKNYYIENNITYDETPKIMGDIIQDSLTQIKRARNDTNQVYKLWRNRKYKQQFSQTVRYANDPVEKKVVLKNASALNVLPKNDNIDNQLIEAFLKQTPNPLQNQLYEKRQNITQNQDEEHLEKKEQNHPHLKLVA